MTAPFEGSATNLPDGAVLECGVCWRVYDPKSGDEQWDISPGTPFSQLPDHWRCPGCDADKGKFMVKSGGAAMAQPMPLPALEDRVSSLIAAYTEADREMVGLPVHNPALCVDAIGFRAHADGYAGVVVTPWCMNVAMIPAEPGAAPPLAVGSKRQVHFPSGAYTMIAGRMGGVGLVETCSLFSPMDEFESMDTAVLTAEAAVDGLFTEETPEPAPKLTRRFVLTRNGAPT